MVDYTCIKCKKKFKVVRWFSYVFGGIITFGYGLYHPFFYCDKCYFEK